MGRGWRHREARETKWRSGIAAVVGVFCNLNVFKDSFGHHSYRGALFMYIRMHPIGLVTGCTNIFRNWHQVYVRHLMLRNNIYMCYGNVST